jgi:hypothetical protein
MSLQATTKCGTEAGTFLDYQQLSKINIEVGDLIEVLRKPYRHWVIVESVVCGIPMCFHIGSIPGMTDEEALKQNRACIRYEPLFDILLNNTEKTPSTFRINNQESNVDKYKNKLGERWPTNHNVNEELVILHENKGTVVYYDILNCNCEHWVTRTKYGVGWSDQVALTYGMLKGTVTGALFGVGVVLLTLIIAQKK